VAGAQDVVVIIGGGHNGLVAAAYLARAGLRVAVLERRPALGGAAATEEIHPGFRCPTGAHLCGLLRPEVIRDLELERHGLRFLPFDPAVVALGESGKALRLWREERRAQAEIATHSPRDAAAYPRFRAWMVQFAGIVDPLMTRAPPDIAAPSAGDQLLLLRRAVRIRRLGRDFVHQALRFAPMSLRDVLGEWFEGELLQASLAIDGLLGTFRGPYSPGTAFGLVHHYLAEVHGGSWTAVHGGMASLTEALAAAARELGVSIRTGAEVERVVISEGRATGVELVSGERIDARIVVSSADPKRTFLRLVDPIELSADFLGKIRNFNTEGAVAKVNIALRALPRIPALGGDGGRAPHLRVCPSLEYLERAYDDAKYGKVSSEPMLDVFIPSILESGLAPPGGHVMSVVVQYAPYHLRPGNWDDAREDLGHRTVEILETHMPGLRAAVAAVEVLTPLDLERRFGLTGGHVYHGEMTLDQQFVLRPVPGWARYRTPIENLYLCGSGAHPGGGITGAPGYTAAREILRDWKRLGRSGQRR